MSTLQTQKLKLLGRSVLRHDLVASFSVFFVALPLCLGVSLASNAPLYSGLIAGVIGGIVVPLISRSALSVSGPAAGLTAICAAIILQSPDMQSFYLAVLLAGVFQIVLGIVKLGGFTHFIPSAVIKGMLAAIGVLLISKQIPLVLGAHDPGFWNKELFNVFTFHHGFSETTGLDVNAGAIIISVVSIVLLLALRYAKKHKHWNIPAAFVVVVAGAAIARMFNQYVPALALSPEQYVVLPDQLGKHMHLPDITAIFSSSEIWKNAMLICFVASLETLLSVAAIDKLDPKNRITPQNRELVAQGFANMLSGLASGLPVTAVIVRSSANVEAGAQSRWSAILHGVWLALAILFGISIMHAIPYCVLAVLLIFTGYALAKPILFKQVYQQGREQFMPFIVTFVAILFSDLLIGVGIGVIYAIYYLIRHTYRAGYTLKETHDGHITHYHVELALNVSFMNKKRIMDMLDKIPPYSIVEINGTDSVYIDRDVLEVFEEFKAKAHNRHIQLILIDIPSVTIMAAH